MPAPVGADHISAIVNRHLMDDVVDLAYTGNPLFFRIYNSNRRFIEGGYQIEQPVIAYQFTAGGSFSELEPLNMAPQDTERSAAWGWKEKYVPVVFSNLSLVKMDTSESIANGVQIRVEQAAMMMREHLGTDLYSDGTNPKDVEGLRLAIATTGIYGGWDRSSATWFAGVLTAGAALGTDFTLLQNYWSAATRGGKNPTIGITTQVIYNKILTIAQAKTQYHVNTNEKDTVLANAGFHNVLYNGTPLVIDPKCPSGDLYWLTEDFIKLAVSPRSDFFMEPFQRAYNQAGIGTKLLFTGNLLVTAPAVQHRVTGVS